MHAVMGLGRWCRDARRRGFWQTLTMPSKIAQGSPPEAPPAEAGGRAELQRVQNPPPDPVLEIGGPRGPLAETPGCYGLPARLSTRVLVTHCARPITRLSEVPELWKIDRLSCMDAPVTNSGVVLSALMRDLLSWLDRAPRSYAETMEAWRSSCPRLTIWEDALADGFVQVEGGKGTPWGQQMVGLTPRGRAALNGG